MCDSLAVVRPELVVLNGEPTLLMDFHPLPIHKTTHYELGSVTSK
ncbi:hypothetical protein NIES4102_17030 [Chondrocystis sp. NIES-4102]|nr:hypothetical protein NIES4102_17030 [Chondrocystis sp. NIES-4102]